MGIYIIDENNYFSKNDIKYFNSVLKKLFKFLEIDKNTEICLTFINDVNMRNLNKRFRGINRSTDVLSFPQEGPVTDMLGDIIISQDTVKRNSLKYRKGLNEEITNLIIHGLLHLLRYDHKKNKDKVIMRQKEGELLRQIKTEN